MDNRDDRRSDTNFVLVDHNNISQNNINQNNMSYNNMSYHNMGYNNIDYDNGFGRIDYNRGYHKENIAEKNNIGYDNANYMIEGADNQEKIDSNYQRSEYSIKENHHDKSEFSREEIPVVEVTKTQMATAQISRAAMPKAETAKDEISKDETSNAETPKGETPRLETPKAEISKVVTAKGRTSKAETKRNSGLGFAKVAVLLIISCAILGLGLGFGYKWGETYFAGNSPDQSAVISNSSVEGANVISSDSSAASEEVGQAGLNNSDIAKAINNPLNGSVSLANIAENTKKAVVAITSHEITRNYIMGEVEIPTSGTGIVYQITADKVYIVTNSHVVGEGATSVKFEHQNEPVDVEFIGRDEVTDVAVISVNKSDLNAEALAYIKPIKFSDSDKVRVGDFVMVVGNPLGYDYTTTFGIVSGLNRNTQLTSEDLLIQVDAAVNRGNSGGPLVNMAGELIGVINQKMNTLTAEGIGFAIPANRVMEDIKFLVENKENPSTSQAFLGITGEAIDENASEYYKLPLGVLVRSTLKGAGAQTGGIKEGDIIIEADGKKITNMVELQRIVSRKKPDEEISVKVFRVQEGEITIKVKLSDKSKFKLNRE